MQFCQYIFNLNDINFKRPGLIWSHQNSKNNSSTKQNIFRKRGKKEKIADASQCSIISLIFFKAKEKIEEKLNAKSLFFKNKKSALKLLFSHFSKQIIITKKSNPGSLSFTNVLYVCF